MFCLSRFKELLKRNWDICLTSTTIFICIPHITILMFSHQIALSHFVKYRMLIFNKDNNSVTLLMFWYKKIHVVCHLSAILLPRFAIDRHCRPSDAYFCGPLRNSKDIYHLRFFLHIIDSFLLRNSKLNLNRGKYTFLILLRMHSAGTIWIFTSILFYHEPQELF